MPRRRSGERSPRRWLRGATQPLTLSDTWRAWVAENLLRGVAPPRLAAILRDQGVPARVAERDVAAIATSPILLGGRRIAQRLTRLELVASLQRRLASLADRPGEVERRARLPREEFFNHYFTANRPVVLTEAAAGWKALTRWSPAYLRDHFGDVEIEVVTGREGDPDCDIHFEAHTAKTTMASFADRVAAAGETNDIYMVANNRNLERTALAELFDDVEIPAEYLDPARRRGCVSMWFGPAGTVTPLHHDTTNILFCQVFGRKRIRLASPMETALLRDLRGVYSAVDVDDLGGAAGVAASAAPPANRLEDVQVKETVLSPGEALFIPVGWWHHVRALEVSINVSFTNFLRPNSFDWYVPGR